MAYNYINKSGLQYIWNKIKAKFVAKDGDKVLSDNNFTDALKTKLDGIATGANKTTVDTALSSTSTNPVQNKVVNSALGGKLSTTGTAAAAKKLATARTVQTNLGSATAASFDGTSNITPGITGTLTVAHGGTGATSAADARTNLGITAANIGALPSGGAAASAKKLTTARTIRTNLASTSTASFDGSANVTPGVTGTLPIANGGTGATTAANARSNLGIGSSATKSISSATNTRDAVAYIGTDGVMEIGPYIDFHLTEDGTEDYDVRMGITSSNTTFSKPVNVASGGTGLTASPSMLTNLGSTTAANVLQTSPRPGITGTLSVGHGGTGITSNPSLQVNLASGSAASVFASSPRPGVTGILPVSHGGTGVNTLNDLKEALGVSSGGGMSPGTSKISLTCRNSHNDRNDTELYPTLAINSQSNVTRHGLAGSSPNGVEHVCYKFEPGWYFLSMYYVVQTSGDLIRAILRVGHRFAIPIFDIGEGKLMTAFYVENSNTGDFARYIDFGLTNVKIEPKDAVSPYTDFNLTFSIQISPLGEE